MIHRFNAIPTKIPTITFAEIEKPILKFTWNFKEPKIAETILEKNKVERLMFSDFKTYYKSTRIKQCGTDIRTEIYISEKELGVQK